MVLWINVGIYGIHGVFGNYYDMVSLFVPLRAFMPVDCHILSILDDCKGGKALVNLNAVDQPEAHTTK